MNDYYFMKNDDKEFPKILINNGEVYIHGEYVPAIANLPHKIISSLCYNDRNYYSVLHVIDNLSRLNSTTDPIKKCIEILERFNGKCLAEYEENIQ